MVDCLIDNLLAVLNHLVHDIAGVYKVHLFNLPCVVVITASEILELFCGIGEPFTLANFDFYKVHSTILSVLSPVASSTHGNIVFCGFISGTGDLADVIDLTASATATAFTNDVAGKVFVSKFPVVVTVTPLSGLAA